MNVHSDGGYFMWPPGAYIAAGRMTLPAPNIGVEKYFWAASDRVLNRVKEDARHGHPTGADRRGG